MKKTFFSLAVGVLLLSSCCEQKQSADQSFNPSEHLVMANLWYQRSSECRALYYQAYNMAKLSLDEQLKTNKSKKPKAVVVDIDETVLDNSPFETNSIRKGLTYSPKNWKEWVDMAKAQPTPGSLEFLKYAASKGVETFYISNRNAESTGITLKNLQKFGFPFADKDHILLKTDTSIKTERRAQVSKTHEILILAGDVIGDFDEFLEDRSENYGFGKVDAMKNEFGAKFIILPNPRYGSWEHEILKSDKKLNAREKEELRKKKLIGYENL